MLILAIGHWEIVLDFKSKYQNFVWRKFNWKGRLQSLSHFISASVHLWFVEELTTVNFQLLYLEVIPYVSAYSLRGAVNEDDIFRKIYIYIYIYWLKLIDWAPNMMLGDSTLASAMQTYLLTTLPMKFYRGLVALLLGRGYITVNNDLIWLIFIPQDCFTSTVTIVWSPRCQWSDPDIYE